MDDDLDGWATGRLLSTAARMVEHGWDTHLAGWDLNHASFVVLWTLAEGPLTQRELARRMQVQEQTMGRVVERLERGGHVDRRRDDADRRRVLVSATEAGRCARVAAMAGSSAEAGFTDVLGDDGTAALRGHLVSLVRELSARRRA